MPWLEQARGSFDADFNSEWFGFCSTRKPLIFSPCTNLADALSDFIDGTLSETCKSYLVEKIARLEKSTQFNKLFEQNSVLKSKLLPKLCITSKQIFSSGKVYFLASRIQAKAILPRSKSSVKQNHIFGVGLKLLNTNLLSGRYLGWPSVAIQRGNPWLCLSPDCSCQWMLVLPFALISSFSGSTPFTCHVASQKIRI